MHRRCCTSRPTASCARGALPRSRRRPTASPMCWRALGVAPGTIVGIHLPQCPESLIAHVAIQKLGAIALPMFNLFGPDAIAYRLGDSGARVLISTPDALERNAEALRGIDTLAACRQRRRRGAGSRAGFLAARRARVAARRNRRHRPRRSGAADLHLGDHRQPEGRAACRPRAARPPAGRDACRTISSRSRATASGRRPTGPGPADCSTCCGRRSTTAWRWWAVRDQVRSRVGVRLHGAARHPQHLHAADGAAPDAPGARSRARGMPTRCARSAPAARSWART